MRGAVQMQSAKTSGRDDFNTPPEVLARVRLIGHVQFDPCWNEYAATVLAPSTLDYAADGGERGDGLSLDWSEFTRDGLAFVNFPYSAAAAWSTKVAQESDLGVPIVVLCAARTDTKWWRLLWTHCDVVAFWHGRIRFWLDGAPAKHGATFASALFGFNVMPRRFRAALGGVATVVVP
jgi:hypothetical protein